MECAFSDGNKFSVVSTIYSVVRTGSEAKLLKWRCSDTNRSSSPFKIKFFGGAGSFFKLFVQKLKASEFFTFEITTANSPILDGLTMEF